MASLYQASCASYNSYIFAICPIIPIFFQKCPIIPIFFKKCPIFSKMSYNSLNSDFFSRLRRVSTHLLCSHLLSSYAPLTSSPHQPTMACPTFQVSTLSLLSVLYFLEKCPIFLWKVRMMPEWINGDELYICWDSEYIVRQWIYDDVMNI